MSADSKEPESGELSPEMKARRRDLIEYLCLNPQTFHEENVVPEIAAAVKAFFAAEPGKNGPN